MLCSHNLWPCPYIFPEWKDHVPKIIVVVKRLIFIIGSSASMCGHFLQHGGKSSPCAIVQSEKIMPTFVAKPNLLQLEPLSFFNLGNTHSPCLCFIAINQLRKWALMFGFRSTIAMVEERKDNADKGSKGQHLGTNPPSPHEEDHKISIYMSCKYNWRQWGISKCHDTRNWHSRWKKDVLAIQVPINEKR